MTRLGETRPIWMQGGDLFSRVTSQDTVRAADARDYVSDQATIWRWRDVFQSNSDSRMPVRMAAEPAALRRSRRRAHHPCRHDEGSPKLTSYRRAILTVRQ